MTFFLAAFSLVQGEKEKKKEKKDARCHGANKQVGRSFCTNSNWHSIKPGGYNL